MAKKEGTLTPKQRKFVEEYVKDYNAIKAYMRAYPDAAEKTARRNQYKYLKKPEILEYLHQLQEEAVRQAGIGPAKILKKLDDIISDPTSTKAEQMKAMELMSKNLGLQTQKVETTAKVVVINIDDEDDDNTD